MGLWPNRDNYLLIVVIVWRDNVLSGYVVPRKIILLSYVVTNRVVLWVDIEW